MSVFGAPKRSQGPSGSVFAPNNTFSQQQDESWDESEFPEEDEEQEEPMPPPPPRRRLVLNVSAADRLIRHAVKKAHSVVMHVDEEFDNDSNGNDTQGEESSFQNTHGPAPTKTDRAEVPFAPTATSEPPTPIKQPFPTKSARLALQNGSIDAHVARQTSFSELTNGATHWLSSTWKRAEELSEDRRRLKIERFKRNRSKSTLGLSTPKQSIQSLSSSPPQPNIVSSSVAQTSNSIRTRHFDILLSPPPKSNPKSSSAASQQQQKTSSVTIPFVLAVPFVTSLPPPEQLKSTYVVAAWFPGTLRAGIVKWLSENGDYKLPNRSTLSEFVPDWPAYCAQMAKNRTWGDHLTLIAASELHSVRIVLFSSVPGDKFMIEIKPKGPAKSTIHLAHLAEWHYESVIPNPK